MGKFDVRTTMGIDFKVNKVELDALKKDLQSLKNMSLGDFMNINKNLNFKEATTQLNQIKNYSEQVQQALSNAFNLDLGTINVSKLSTEIRKLPIADIYRSFQQAGASGTAAFNSISSAVLKGNLQLKESNKLIDKMATTMANTIRFGISSSIFNNLTNGIQKAWEFTKQLDTSLNDIRIVTGKSADEMERFAQVANRSAQNLGATTQDYTKAALIYYQQGLDDAETQARADVTVKTANVTGQQASKVSEQLTAIWNGYKVDASEAELYIDKVAKVAATTAADLEEMATGMSKVASAANSAGVDIDQLNAMLATVISVTREAPETIGTSFRTIFARLGDLKMGGTDEDGLGLGTVSKQIHNLGVDILDQSGNMRDMGDIIEDIAAKWQTLSDGEQQALAVAAAGKQQYSRFIALFDNWDMYEKALEDSKNAEGELQEQQDIYMDSTEAHLNKLTAAQERVSDAFVNNESTNKLIDIFTGLTNGVANFIEALGGGGAVLQNFGAIATRVFSRQIANGINQMINNMQIAKQNAIILKRQLEDLQWLQQQAIAGSKDKKGDPALAAQIQQKERMQQYTNLNPAQIEQGNSLISNLGQKISEQEQYLQKYNQVIETAKRVMGRNDITDVFTQLVDDTQGAVFKQKMESYRNDILDLDAALDELPQSIQNYVTASGKMAEATDKTEKKLQAQKDKSYQYLNDNLENILNQSNFFARSSSLNLDDKTRQNIQADVKELQNIIQQQVKAVAKGEDGPLDLLGADRDWDKKFQDLLNRLKAFTAAARKEIQDSVDLMNNEERTQGGQVQHNQEQVDNAQNDIDEFFSEEDRKLFIQDITTMVGGVTSLASAFSSLNNIGNIWDNENLPTVEKFLQTIIALSMATTQLITGYNSLKTAGVNVIAVITRKVAAQQVEALTGKSLNDLKDAEIAKTGVQIGLKKLLTKETWAHVAAQMAEHWYLLAAAVAIGAVTVALYASAKARNADNEAAEKAKNTAKELVESQTDLQNSADTLRQSFDAYQTAKEKLESCTEGTKEFDDALADTNKTAIELLNNLGQLSSADVKKLYQRDTQSGLLQLNDDLIEDIISRKESQARAAEYATAIGNESASIAGARANISNAAREMYTGNNTWLDDRNATKSSMDENNIRSITNLAMNSLQELGDTSLTVDEFKQKLQETASKDITNFADTLLISDDEMQTFQKEVQGAADQAAAASEKLRLISELTVQEELGTGTDSTVVGISSNILEANKKQIKQSVLDALTGKQIDVFANENNSVYQDMLDRLNKAGYNYTLQSNNPVLGWDKDRRLAFTDENGERVERDADWIASTIAASEALSKVATSAEEANKALANLNKNAGEDIAQTMRDWIENRNFENATEKDVNQISQEVNGDTNGYLQKIFGVSSPDALKKILGDDYERQFNNSLEGAKKGFENMVNSYAQSVQDAFNSLDTSNLSLSAQKTLSKIFADIFTLQGQEGLDYLTSMIKEVPVDQLDEFSLALSNVSNWSDVTLDSFNKTLKEAGVTTQFTDDQLQGFINSMQQITAAANDFSQISADYAEVQKSIKGINIGDTIDKEAYDTLSVEAQSYFTLMLDGTYKLIKGADQLDAVVEKGFKNRFRESQRQIEAQIQGRENVLNANYDTSTLFKQQSLELDNSVYKPEERAQEAEQKYQQYIEEANRVAELGFKLTDTVFGNIDLNNRKVLEWTKYNLDKYQDEINSWDLDVQQGDKSTVLGMSEEFDGQEIAFTPMLQTSSGAVLLDKSTVEEYIGQLIDNQGEGWTTEALIQADIEGLDITDEEGKTQHISNLIAGIGDNARNIGEVMHYLGEDGSIAATGMQAIVQQLSFLKDMNAGDLDALEQISKWEEELKNGQLGVDSLRQMAEECNKFGGEVGVLDEKIAQLRENMLQNELAYGSQIDNLRELREAYEDNTISAQAFNTLAENLWNQEREKDLDSDEIKDYAQYIRDIADETADFSDDLSDGTDTAAESSRDLAIQIMRMNEGVEELADNWDDWSDVLKHSSKSSKEYFDALSDARESIADLLDIGEDFISSDFITNAGNMKLISQAATGSAEAIDKLRASALQDIIMHIDFDESDVINNAEALKSRITDIQSQLNGMNLQVGASIDTDGIDAGEQALLNACNDMIKDAGLTTDQVNALFSAMGYDVTYDSNPQEVTQVVPIYETTHAVKEGGGSITDADGVEHKGWVELTETHQIGSKTYTGQVQLPAMAASEPGTTVVPKINNITKKATGSANNYSSKNKGGGSPGKSSGGGGGSKAKDPDTMDRVEDTPDRYHKVNTQLEKISNELDNIQSQEKKFTGAKLISNINAQLDKLDERIDRLREKQSIAYGEADELRQKLAAQGVTFNDDGTIANYMEIYNSKLGYVNSLIDKYNAMSADEQENFKDTVEAAKKDYDKFKEDLDNYDELVSSTIPGLTNDIQDAVDEQIELNIKKFDIEFDIRLNLKDATQEWNEFKKKILDGIKDDDIFGNARARAVDDLSVYLNDNGTGFLEAATRRTNQVYNELQEMDATGKSSVYGDDRKTAMEDLQKGYQEINDALMEIDQIQEDVYQAWLDTMDDISDQIQEQVDMYEQIHDIIDHDMKVIELVYGESDYEALGKYYQKQHDNYLGLLDFQRQNVEFWETEMNNITDKNSEAFKKARENWMSAVKDLEGTVEEAIENARDKMENAIDDTFKKFNEKITNGKGLDYLQQQWDLINDLEDDYLDEVNEAFGIRQLERKYLDAIDQTDNVSNQRKLNKLMEEELAKLREKDKLTEYDIERANKRYEIELKRLALEEAQQTKDTMRLRRDSQGNYRYEYVADEDNIRKLQDELDVLENELYNFDKERWLEMQNQVVDAVQERQDAIKEILMDASLSEEERAERLAEINDLYNQKIQNITDQTVTAQENLYESGATELNKIWEEEGRNFNELNDEMQRHMVEEILPQFKSGVNEMIESFTGPGGFKEQTTESMDALSEATQQYTQDLSDVETQAGYSFDNIEDGLDRTIDKTQQQVQDNDELNNSYQEQIQKIEELNKKLQEQIAKYQGIKTAAEDATKAAYNYWKQQNEIDAANAAKENNKTTSDAPAGSGTGSGSGSGSLTGNSGGGSGGGSSNASKAEGVAAAIWVMGGATSGWYNGGDRFSRLREKFGSESVVQDIINSQGPNGQLTKKWLSRKGELSNYYYGRFNTGGYTGDWVGDYGKFAMLDKKELVLNAGDTENMLDMIKIARDVIATAGPRVDAVSAGTNAVNSAAAALEQNVHIDANFPNVESAAEIEQALNNLVNLAAQRASRNTRG